MQCWDDERVDPTRTINRIINGVFHHPAQRMMGEDGAADGRRMMFGVVEQWWRSANQDELRRKLSREGVQNMENHLEGVHDTGHGCGKPLGMAKNVGGPSSPIGQAAGGLMGALTGAAGQGGGATGIEKFAEEAVGGGALGGLVGALAGGVGGSLLSGAFGGSSSSRQEPETSSFASSGRTHEGGYQQSYTELGRSGDQYAQAQYSETQLPGGGRETDYQQFQQRGNEYGSGFEERTEQRPTYGGGYEQTTERIYQTPSEVETETWREGRTADGRHYHEAHPEIRSERRGGSDSGSDDSSGRRKHHHKKQHGRGESGEVRGEDYIAPSSNAYGGGGAYGEPPRAETFEERRHEREFESQPAGYSEREAPRRAFEDEGFGNRFQEQPRGEAAYGSGAREHGNEAGWGEERVREDVFGGERRGGGYGERQEETRVDEYREEVREEEYREEVREEEYREEVSEEAYREETSEGGGW